MQAAFQAALLNPEAAIPAGLVDPFKRPAGRRFSVYRNNVTASLTRALEDGFPILQQIVGPEFFAAMALVFLRQHPPRSQVLMFYGADMPEFLQTFPPVAHLGYLPDVARLELALRNAYHAADAQPLTAGTLATLSPDAFIAARLRLAPAVQVITSRWPLYDIWRTNTDKATTPLVMAAQSVVILRPEFDPTPHLLPEGGARFLAALAAAKSVEQAVDDAGPAHDLARTLALMINGGGFLDLNKE